MSDVFHTRLIKKYPNRRLYDTQSSCHITLSEVRQLVLDEVSFCVVDAKTGEDLTRSVLLQIIQEAEGAESGPIFSTDMLRSVIRCYGPWQGVVSRYLDKSIQMLVEVQSKNGMRSTQPWIDFMRSQTPLIADMLVRYLEQSGQLYMNTQKLFGFFPVSSSGRSDTFEKEKK